jgi:hypothetical protein
VGRKCSYFKNRYGIQDSEQQTGSFRAL